jgi:hypothetical protein
MKPKYPKERGQALILIAFAAIGLFLIAGLAIDGSHKYSDRRHAQNAADTAAVAAALEQAKGLAAGKTQSTCKTNPGWSNSSFCSDIINAAWNRATDNGYDGMLNNDVEVYSPPLTGVYANCSDVHFDCKDYIQVVITSNRETWFMRILGIDQFTNVVKAVASTRSANNSFTFGGNAVVALSPATDCSSPTLMAQGSSNVAIYGGGLFSNSDSSTCAFFRQSCPSGTLDVYTDSTETTKSTITMVGNTTSGCISTNAVFQSGAKQIPFPPPQQELSEPAECSQTVDSGSNYTVTGSGPSSTASLQPGHYSKWPLNGQWRNMILAPGVYCIDTSLNSPDSITVSGTTPGTDPGVLIYIRSGGSTTPLTFNGGSTISLWGINSNNDSSLNQYRGFLIYVAPNYSSGTPATCKINGNSDYFLKGTIYAPYCNVTIDGTSNTGKFQSQVIGYTVKFSGTADVVLTYEGGDNAVWSIPSQVGLSK